MIKYVVVFIAWCLLTSPLASAREIDTFIPKNAYPLMPLVAEEAAKFNTPFDVPFLFALMEGESCIHLRHRRCFSTTSRFKTRYKNGRNREEGGGLGQLTRTWHRNGRIRFDTLSRLTKKYRTHLKGLNWNNLYSQKKLQVRAIIFLNLENWNAIGNNIQPCEKLPMLMSSYNQGLGGLKQDIRLCGVTKRCNPKKWFGNVEKVKRWGFGTRILYGRRTAWDINRKHTRLVMKNRRPKYSRYFNNLKE